MAKVIFHIIRNCSQRKEFAPSGSKFFPLIEVRIAKRESIKESHCLIQKSPFDARNFFGVLATQCVGLDIFAFLSTLDCEGLYFYLAML